MMFWRRWAFALAFVSAAFVSHGSAQQTPEAHCFSVKIRLDGKPLDQPSAIFFYTKEHEWSVTREGDCFDLSTLPAKEKFFDIFFDVENSRILFPRLSAANLAGPWEIDLYNQGSAKKLGLPEGTKVQTACRVVFHTGGLEAGLMKTGCRKKIR